MTNLGLPGAFSFSAQTVLLLCNLSLLGMPGWLVTAGGTDGPTTSILGSSQNFCVLNKNRMP